MIAINKLGFQLGHFPMTAFYRADPFKLCFFFNWQLPIFERQTERKRDKNR